METHPTTFGAGSREGKGTGRWGIGKEEVKSEATLLNYKIQQPYKETRGQGQGRRARDDDDDERGGVGGSVQADRASLAHQAPIMVNKQTTHFTPLHYTTLAPSLSFSLSRPLLLPSFLWLRFFFLALARPPSVAFLFSFSRCLHRSPRCASRAGAN